VDANSAIHLFTLIAVRTQYLKIGGEFVFHDPPILMMTLPVNLSLNRTIIIDVVEN
jgi:hypothetical protein